MAAALRLGLIAVESTSLLSTANTGRILYPLLTFFFGPLDPVKFAYWHHLLRKAGHVIGYGMLSFLLFRAWRTTLPVANAARWSWKWCRTALVMTADRKSTRLNSSHSPISYAGFCFTTK